MATKPKIVTLTNSSVDILNVIRNNSSVNYQKYVPLATPDADSIREIGTIIMDYPNLQNEFLSALVNRIGRVILTSKMYKNPLSMFKKGLLEFGESIEEIFVNIAKPFQFDPDVAESNLFKREIPDVRTAFHIMNYQKYYKATISNDQLRQAFMSWQGITDLISKIVDAMYTGANYDEFQTMKYLLAKHIINGRFFPVTIETVSSDNMKSIATTIKGVSNDLAFLSDKYNVAGVYNSSEKQAQYLMMDTRFDASMDVEVLASAFNMDKAEFMGKRVLVDGFGKIDTARLNVLFADDPTYVPLTDEELEALNSIPCVLIDENWFMIFDNFFNFTEQYNGEGLYWNYWYHVWKTFSVSPFHNNVLFVPGEPEVSSITVSPASASVPKGQSITFSATVATEYFAPKKVNWEVSDSKAIINKGGMLTIPLKYTGASSITVKAVSAFDDSVYGEASVTVV